MTARRLILLVVGVWCLIGSRLVGAQGVDGGTYTLVLRGVPMSQALEELVGLTQIDLVYNSNLVTGKHVYCAGRNLDAEALLRCVLQGTGLDYVRSSTGTYVLMEALEEAARHGDLAGSIVDLDTGEALPYANVLLADASTGTTTDEAGLFSFSSVLSGMQRIVVTYVGYETAVDSIFVAAGERERLEIALRPRAVSLAPIVINGLAQRLPSSDLGAGVLSSRQLTAFYTAGTPDVARGAGSLMGVAVQQPLADLHIQGSASGEHLTVLDGVPVRDPVSLGRHLSAFSPLAIDRLTVHKAGFGAAYGSHLSGVVAVEQDVIGAARRGAVVNADPVSINGKVQGRFTLPGVEQGTAMLALRTSVWDLYQDPGVDALLRRWNQVDPILATRWVREEVSTASLGLRRHEADVAFSDLHAAVRLRLSPFRSIHASAYRARNRIASDLAAVNSDNLSEADLLVLTRDDYDWTNWAAQIRHDWLIGARSVGTVQLQGGWHDSRYAYRGLLDQIAPLMGEAALEQAIAAFEPELGHAGGSEEHNKIRELALKVEFSHSLSPRHHVEAGLDARHVDSRFQLKNQFLAAFMHEAAAWDVAGYAQGELSFGLQTTLEPGVRLTYLPLRQAVYAEPRLAVRYDRAASRIGPYAARVAGGVYRQFTNQFELTSSGSTSVVPYVSFWLPVDSTQAPPLVYHLAADVLLMPAPRWTISLESYYKWQPRLLVVDYARLRSEHPAVWPPTDPVVLSQEDLVGVARGRAYGGSARLHRTAERLDASVSYSYSRALHRYPGRFDGRMEPAPWNQPHRLTLDATVTMTPTLSIDANWRGAWGRRWAARRAYYDYLALGDEPLTFELFDLNRPADQVVPPYYRLDAGLTYARSWGRTTMQLRAFVVNVLDRNNVYDWSVEETPAGEARIDRTLPGRHPVFSLRLDY